MTKKDYKAIAEVVRGRLLETKYVVRPRLSAQEIVEQLAYDLARVMKNDNDRFNEEIFLSACGLN